MPKSESLPVLFALLSNSEQIATVAFYKRVTVSDSLPLLFTKEQCEREPQFHSLAHKKRVIRFKNKKNMKIKRNGFRHFFTAE